MGDWRNGTSLVSARLLAVIFCLQSGCASNSSRVYQAARFVPEPHLVDIPLERVQGARSGGTGLAAGLSSERAVHPAPRIAASFVLPVSLTSTVQPLSGSPNAPSRPSPLSTAFGVASLSLTSQDDEPTGNPGGRRDLRSECGGSGGDSVSETRTGVGVRAVHLRRVVQGSGRVLATCEVIEELRRAHGRFRKQDADVGEGDVTRAAEEAELEIHGGRGGRRER